MKEKIWGAILILIISIPIFIIGGTLFNTFIYIISLLAMNEFLNIKEKKKNIPFFIKCICLISLTFLIFSNVGGSLVYSIDCRVLSGIFSLFLIPTVLYHDRLKYSVNDAFYLIGGVLFLGISFSLILLIRNISINLLVYIFLIGICSDIYAYITGNLIGSRILLKDISPNKTIEGMLGGLLFGVFIPVVYYLTVIDPEYNIFCITFITMFLCILGIIGDLCFSAIKRYFEKKDFSKIIPGHGGILDRFDSIIFILLGVMFFIDIIGG